MCEISKSYNGFKVTFRTHQIEFKTYGVQIQNDNS